MGHYSDSPKPENSGRRNRLQGRSVENEPENFNPLLINDPAPMVPQPAVPLLDEKEHKPSPAPANPSKKPKTPSAPKTPKAPGKKTAKEQEPEDTADKDKYSIYLTKGLSITLRIANICTRKAFSHITECALNDMLRNRYQCDNPNCLTRFSMSETDATPICCPACGKNQFSPLRYDLG